MEINIINQSGEARWTRYKHDFITIADKTMQVLKLTQDACASVIFVTPDEIHTIKLKHTNKKEKERLTYDTGYSTSQV